MGQKLHRSRQTMFRKKHTWLRTISWIVAAVLIIGAGFFGAKLLDERPAVTEPDSSAATDPDTSAPGAEPGEPENSNPSEPTQPTDTKPQTADALRAFYLPLSALRDTTTLTGSLEQAAQAGFNSVVFDLKDRDGLLYYRFTCPQAQQVNSYTDDAFSVEELQTLFSTIQAAGLQPIPRLYAFQDHAGAKVLSAARITVQGGGGVTWHDNKPANGGKAWLNPYADEAHSYIIQLAQELKEAGAAAILLEGVQFPYQTSSADYGNSSNTALSRDEVLALFIDKIKLALEDCPVILGCTAESALGTETQVYGNNPLTFAPSMAAPAILPGSLPQTIRIGETAITNTPEDLQQTVEALVNQMVLRTKVMATDSQPTLVPMLQAEGYTPAQINQEIAGCLAGGTEGYILYHPKGNYDFAALGN